VLKGLRDPKGGYASEPFGFTKAVADEVQERVDSNPEATEGGDAYNTGQWGKTRGRSGKTDLYKNKIKKEK